MTETRPCTCAPDERPYPCQHQYALGLCRKAEIRSLRAELDRCIAQIGDLAKLRSEEEITHGHVMGRIAIALFSERNNRTDEECVAKVAEVVYERDNLRKHLHDEHQRHIGTMNERDALAALLRELVALVRGECPSLLNEDSGGDAKLSCDIDAALGKDKP